MRLLPTALLVLAVLGCDGSPGPHTSEVEVYAALLTDTAAGVPRTIALDPQLISDSGTYEPSGRLSPRTIDALRRRGLFSEVCGEKRVEHGFIECTTRKAPAAVQLSRILPGRGDTVIVRIGRNTVQPQGDTASFPINFAVQESCRLVRDGADWRVVRCEREMIT